MFGIGLPELIVILAVGLIVVGPEKMPDLARSLAKGLVELKKAAGALKDSLHEDETVQEVTKVQSDIKAAFQSLPPDAFPRDEDSPPAEETADLPYPPDEEDDNEELIDAETKTPEEEPPEKSS